MKQHETINNLAFEVLEKAGRPLHYQEIADLIMKVRRLKGKTPRNTVNAVLHKDPRFKKDSKSRNGIYGLSEWQDTRK